MKENISNLKMLNWDDYKSKSPEESLSLLYESIRGKSIQMCTWYWASIIGKKRMSLIARVLAMILLIAGTLLPLLAALNAADSDKLKFTQWGIALLAGAGLITVSDRVFGWSSGWMRYISTVTTMENLSRAFELEWASYIVSKTTPLDSSDVKILFDLSTALEKELTKLQADETMKWVAEFNTSISLLESMIKIQREETDKKLDTIRTNISNQASTAKNDEKLKSPGALEVSFIYKAKAEKLRLGLDNSPLTEFEGYTTWSKLDILPGLHQFHIETISANPLKMNKVVEIETAKTTRLTINIP